MEKLKFIFGVILLSLIMSCSESNTNVNEVANLPEVTIGNQIWMSENLSVSVFRNGDPIPYASNSDEWGEAVRNGQPAYCYYQDNTLNEKSYGKLYNWYAVNDPRGLAPSGWHIPTKEEWTKLANTLGGDPVAGAKMKSITGWSTPNLGATNSSGFSGLPGGYRDLDWLFKDMGKIGTWWTATEEDAGNTAYNSSLINNSIALDRHQYYHSGGLSVRCVKN
jgi:uncharacterized protein (TIGR02145 family)